jgi:hypothetical protein
VSDPVRRPAWSFLIPGRAPSLTGRQWDVLGLVVLADMSSQYSASLLTLALPQIQAGLGIPEDQLGALNA